MIKLSLNGAWKMRRLGTVEQNLIDATVPGSVYSDLMQNGLMEDPFYRDNEDKSLKLMDFDYEYSKEFLVDEEMLESDEILLNFDGLDTLAIIKLNDKLLSSTNNMHRSYSFDVKNTLALGNNSLKVTFSSPTKYIAEEYAKQKIWGANAMPGFPYLRKAHYMFGWDWGPTLPDMGIWRGVSLVGSKRARLEDVFLSQKHVNGAVELLVDLKIRIFQHSIYQLECVITSPAGEIKSYTVSTNAEGAYINKDIATTQLVCPIEDPQLWWPNGYGAQPLYKVTIHLKSESGQIVLDNKEFNIGLKVFQVIRKPDEWGESFEFNINGVSIFALGANYIPEDNILPRCSRQKTETLIQQCVDSNFNCIRVWGGGLYPADYFFDLCDEYGLIVWQDFMFACAAYDLTPEFEKNITAEFIDNIKRIRHHASLCLWCGNNENELALHGWGVDIHTDNFEDRKKDYLKMFEYIIPNTLREYDPNTFYWPSSPSSGGGFQEPNDYQRGDAHYWGVWIGLEPIQEYRKQCFRFMSEFGFISFPSLKTIESFTLPEDRNAFSYVMDKHQKHPGGNGKVMHYLSEEYKYPTTFETFLYASQILQAEAIKYGVENWRKNRGKCMGTIFWQVNDCNPVVSWSSIDYFGRWKALQYYVRKMYRQVLLIATDDGTQVKFNLTNDSTAFVSGIVHWKLRSNDTTIIKQGSFEVQCSKLSTVFCKQLNFDLELQDWTVRRRTYMEFSLIENTENTTQVSTEAASCNEPSIHGTVLFVKPKYFEFLKPTFEVDATDHIQSEGIYEDSFEIKLKSNVFAKSVMLEIEDADCVFSDNYFDISNEKLITLKKADISVSLSATDLKDKLKIRSIYDI